MNKQNFITNRRQFLKKSAVATSALALPWLWIPKAGFSANQKWPAIDPKKPIKIGILFSLTGPEKVTSYELYKASLMAIEDINAAGGIHGAKLEPVIRDPSSQWPNYTKMANELLSQNVNIIWGCMTSASREATLPAVQRQGGLLFYSVLYEGRECSPNLIATGSCPNQQTDVAIPWIMERTGPKTFLVGSNYIFPRTMSKQAKITLKQHQGTVLGDQFFTFGVSDPALFEPVIEEIKEKKPDYILSSLVAGNIAGFLKAYKKSGLTPEQIPILHTGMFESDVVSIGAELCAGHYTSTTYFQSIKTPSNQAFVQRIHEFVQSRSEMKNDPVIVTSPMESAYIGALACKEAMVQANSAHPQAIAEAIRGIEVNAPGGDKVKIDSENLHTWLHPRIGQVNQQGQFKLVYESPHAVRPEVFNPEMDVNRTCRNGGQFYIKDKKVPLPVVKRSIVPQ